jgi:1-acyl-sn-glycerol-3-phosphate acyltransferase
MALRMRKNILVQRSFLLLVGAYGVSAFGDHLLEAGLLKEMNIVESGVKTRINAQLLFFFFLPYVLLGPLAGVVADRLPRRGVMIVADLVRAAIAASLPWFVARFGGSSDWIMMMPVMALGVFACFFNPARQALVPQVVDGRDLTRANSILGGLAPIASIFSFVIGSEIAERVGTTANFLADSATFLVSAVLVAGIVLRRTSPPSTSSFSVAEFRHSLKYIKQHRRVRQLMIFTAAFWTAAGIFSSVMATVVLDWYELDFVWWGRYRATTGLGMILGGAILALLGDATRGHLNIIVGLLGAGSMLVGFSCTAADTAWLGFVLGIGVGMCGVWVLVSANTQLHRIVPNRMRGRVFALVDMANMTGMVVGTFLLGIVHWPALDAAAGWIIAATGIGMVILGVMLLRHHAGRYPHPLAIRLVIWLIDVVSRFWYRLERVGPCTVPPDGACIIASNHTSSADPCFICCASPNRLFGYMIAVEYADPPLFRHLINYVKCIRVRRDGQDVGATKSALRQLRDGAALGVFIEGRIPALGEPRKPLDGVAVLAMRSGAPVIPVHISGVHYCDGIAGCFFKRHRVRIRFGPPVDLSSFTDARDREVVAAATERVWADIQALGPEDGRIYL